MKEISEIVERILEMECDLSCAAHSVEMESVLLRERLQHIEGPEAKAKIGSYRDSIGRICDQVTEAITKIREDVAAIDLEGKKKQATA